MSTLNGYLAACTTLLSWTIGTFAFTHASKLANPASVNRVRLLYAFLVLSILVTLTSGISPVDLFIRPSLQQYFWFGISGFVGLTLGDYFAFTAYRILGSRRTSLFSCFAPGAALMAGWMVLDENIGWIGIMGMAISVTGILLLVLSRKEQKEVQKDGTDEFLKGIIFGALGAICQGLGLVLAKKGFGQSELGFSPLYATWIRMFSAAFFVYLIGVFRLNVVQEFKSITFHSQKFKPVILGTFFGPVIGVSFSLLAATHLEASVAQTIFSLLPATVLLASVWFFREKVQMGAYIAVLVSITGVMIMVWR